MRLSLNYRCKELPGMEKGGGLFLNLEGEGYLTIRTFTQ